MTVFLSYTPSLLIRGRETIHMFHSRSLLAERAIHFCYPWVELLRTTKCTIKYAVVFLFSDKEGQDAVCSVNFLKDF